MAIKIRIDPRTFAKLDQTKASVREVILASILDLDADIRNASPVDTGFFVNSWQAQANGSPAPSEGFEGPGRGGSDPSVIAAGIGGVVSLVNTAEYAEALAAGHSPQAPAGWVEAAAVRLEDHIDRHVMNANARNR